MDIRSATTPSVAGLRSIHLLAAASDEVLQNLCSRCSWRLYRAGERILSKDARDCDVYFIVSGIVRATAFSAGGRQVTYRDMRAGESFGDLAAIDRLPRSADVVAQSESMIASLRAEHFLELLTEVRAVSDALVRHLVDRVRDLSDRLFDLSTLGVENRVDAELLRLAVAAGVVANVARIDPAPTHSDIASQIGTYREQVTREFSQLARWGILDRAGAPWSCATSPGSNASWRSSAARRDECAPADHFIREGPCSRTSGTDRTPGLIHANPLADC